ncbi:MAG: META domain-containing protein [Synergistaceae bacterium]|jgi:putative lipoprotein|nr:META domain-containing protein [Synergistaceae bacterium]
MVKKYFKICLPALLFLSFVAVSGGEAGDEVSVVLGDRTYVMERVETESCEKYETPGDPGTMFRSDGAEAVLTIEGKEYNRYVLLREASGWKELTVTADGGNYALRQVITASGAKYEAPGDPETYFWSKGAAATLCLRGKDYKGYDYWLPSGEIWLAGQSMPTGIEWKAVGIDGTDVIAGSAVTVTFGADGKVSGSASVNNYTAPWLAYGDRIIISNGVSTRKAGTPEMMEQEDRFLKFLPEVVRFVLHKGGLRLISRDGGEMALTK